MESFVNYLFRIPRMMLLLSLMALVCLPIALGKLVRDSSLSLLWPLTILGLLLVWCLVQWRVHKISAGIILLFLGPLALFIRIGQLAGSLFELIKQTISFIPPLINWLRFQIPLDPSSFVLASDDLTQNLLAFGSRLFLWLTSLWQGVEIEDPVIRALIWSVILWWIAAWAGWQIFNHKRLLAGMIPATILLAFILDYTGKEIWILWLHLSLLLFLYGLNSYATLREHWNISSVDYSDSTSADTLLIVSVLTLSLVAVSSLASTISIKDILDNLRAKRASTNEARTESLGLQPASDDQAVMDISSHISDSYRIGPGPELSDQLVMTVSTADLPPMPYNAQPFVRNYYWRTMTYQIYIGSGWANPSFFGEDISPNQRLIEPPYPNYRLIEQEVTFPNETAENIYWTGTLVSADVPFQVLWIRKSEEDLLLESDMLTALAPVNAYHAESLSLDVSAEELRNSPGIYPDWVRDRFLALPDSVPERVLALGRDLSASGKTPYDRAVAIQDYLREYPYSLEVPGPPLGRDVADFFLFDLKTGYCDYYATTMVVLARAAGLPARMVMGYASGSYDVEQAHYFVTENNAHAWVEIYFTGIGWAEFEPTASQPAIVYPEERNAETPAPVSGSQNPSNDRFATLINHALSNAWIPAFLFFMFVLAWIGWDSVHVSHLEPAQSIQLLYRRVRRLTHPITGRILKHQTAHSYSYVFNEKMSSLAKSSWFQNWLLPSRDEINQLTELYARSLFASALPTRMDAHDAIKIWSRLRWRLLLANMLAIKNAGLHRMVWAGGQSHASRY